MLFLAAEQPHNPIVPIWQEVVVGLVAFGLLSLVLMRYVFPRMEQTFQARVEAIEGGIQRAEATQAEANALLQRYKEQLAEARTEAARIRDEARVEAQAIKNDIMAQAQQERDRIIAIGREQLAAERETTVRELRTEVGRLAVTLAGRIVGEALEDEARRRGTVDRFLADLERTGAR